MGSLGMQPKSPFTGRPRRRTTHPWVKFGDQLARVLITFGGLSTIAAVLMVGIFLLAVALPLFRSAQLDFEHAGPVAHGPTGAFGMGTDESGSVVWLFAENDGRLQVLDSAHGESLLSRSAADCGLAEATAIRTLSGTMQAVVGYRDGSLRVGRIGLESTFLAASDLPSGEAIERGAVRVWQDAVIVHNPNGQYSRVELIAELPAHTTASLNAQVIDVDITPLANGSLLAAIDANGRVRVESVSQRRNLLTDAMVQTSTGSIIEPLISAPSAAKEKSDAGRMQFVRVSELGDQLFVMAIDGTALRYDIHDIEAPVLMETFSVTQDAAEVAAVARLFGGTSLAVADSAGSVRVFFATRAAGAQAADGLKMMAAKTFPPAHSRGQAVRITAMAASPRSRLFAVADSTGMIRLLQSTAESTVLSVPATAAGALAGPASQMLIAPRENRLLAVDATRISAWALDAGYPEVSPRSLFGGVWYENYPAAMHTWETTGHESFESKFGLMPLIFGTLKATIYAMRFATPIAILAALYASQFMHSTWRARIKPTIEMMASLPSVVLGFVAGLVVAPLLEQAVMPVITGFFAVPLTLVAGAHLWQLLPAGWRSQLSGWRFPVIMVVALPAGILVAMASAGWVERLLFQGDLQAWLDGGGGSGLGGWVLALLPLAGVATTVLVGKIVNPWLRRKSTNWSQPQAAIVSLGMFGVGVACTVAIAVAAAMFLDALRLDTRGGLFGTYVQRNALVVALGMSFAIIPLIFTIADDALSSVPDHLRSASLGAGATPWQTAVRVIMPTAASGLFSAVMIGLGRAVGETMIVLMAAGNTPLMGWNVFNGFQTLSAAIATELPEAARGSAHFRVLFLAALTLFAMTFVVNTVAEIVRQRFRRRAHEL